MDVDCSLGRARGLELDEPGLNLSSTHVSYVLLGKSQISHETHFSPLYNEEEDETDKDGQSRLTGNAWHQGS